ncbi:MAG: mucoidy inhibitor MuiA family protein [Alphaproteobacteria bacterium]|nr:mucoidy inhibitor MuiA family protein [Alphaproteobacteria bacterium]
MRYVLFLTVLLLPVLAHADDVKVTGTLKAATVYNDRAALTLETTTQVPAGKHVVMFEGLPTGIFTDSLRVKGESQAEAILGALSHKIVNNVELTSAREAELNTQKEKLEEQKKVIEAEIQAINAKKKFLASLEAKAIETTNDEIAEFELNSTSWLEAANTLQAGMDEVLKTELAKQNQIKDINDQIAKINRDLAQVRTGSKQTLTVSLPVEMSRAANLKLSLEYQIGGAYWRPVYDARLSTETGDLELVQYGAVSQRTGEDWSNIALTLSTARPNRGATAPTLNTQWVNLWSEMKKSRGFAGGMARNEMALDRAAVSAPAALELAEEDAAYAPKEARQQVATINTGGFTAEFGIPGLISVPADGTETKVLIAPFETESKLEVHIKPQVDAKAYLVANTTIKGEAPLLPGQVSLFRDGSFVGQTQVPLLKPGKDYDLSFGIDDQIEVEHKTLKDERGEQGMFVGKTDQLVRHTVTEIQNLRNRDVNIVVGQTVPVAQNEKITLEMDKQNTTAGYTEDTENVKGLLEWAFTLKSKEKKDIKLGWTLAWPQGQNISGI